MKIDKPENPNYCATVVEIKNIIVLPNCENVVATSIHGFQAIVGKDTKVGDIGIVFPAEAQLSDEFCYENNLYRHTDKNKVEGGKGYIEDNRRVKAVKFRGNTSSCLFLNLDSFAYTGINTDLLSVGDEFDNLNGKEICRKYVVERKISGKHAAAQEKKFVRVESKHMPEHIDSTSFFKWGHEIDPETEVIVTQKLHGTSIRIGNTIAKRKLSWFESVLNKFGVKIQGHTYDYIFGSRKVIKDVNNPYQDHFYDFDLWTAEGKKLVGFLPENYIVYGELVGWASPETEIQKDYSYSVPKGQAELYIYRIAIVNEQGYLTDLSWNQLKEFCNLTGLKHVPEIVTCKLKQVDINACMNIRFFETGAKNCLYLGENKLVDEGVCIRIDGLTPKIYKAKSPLFLEHETAMLDTGVMDLESDQSWHGLTEMIDNITK